MSLGDRLGIVGLIVALVAIAVTYLWPDRKWIGWLSLLLAGSLLLSWAVLETKARLTSTPASLITCLVLGALVGAVIAAILWYGAPAKSEDKTQKSDFGKYEDKGSDGGHATSQPEAFKGATDKNVGNPLLVSPVDALTGLGWSVTPAENGESEFSVTSKPVPDMNTSAQYFHSLRKPFKIRLQVVKSIGGLHHLAGIPNLVALTLNSVESGDLGELDKLGSLIRLEISQCAINSLAPISRLTNVRELVLTNDNAVRKLTELKTLTHLVKLNLNNTPVSDLSPLQAVQSLKSLDVTGTNATDLAPLVGLEHLSEITISGNSAQGLQKLSGSSITKLNIIEFQRPIDTIGIGGLRKLRDLQIMTPVGLSLSPLRGLTDLSRLSIIGTSTVFGNPNAVIQLQDVQAIGALINLKVLVLARVAVSDLGFITPLGNLEELTVNFTPLVDIGRISELQSLRKVGLAGVPVVDISPLLTLSNLEELDVQGSPARADTLTQLERRGVKVRR